ncbi:pilus assembly protein TadG-related protein [Mesorhizobium sp. 2RAF45]|uniref:pilus assembly protein TadG-related protein n=1 Tax=Mesorhizobium sp. 2RAF45 TaxID=3233001 RepID=UPI003F948045
MFYQFLSCKRGNFAIFGAVCVVPLVLTVGFAVDYSRLVAAHSRLQTVADAAALAVAGSKETDQARIREMAEAFVAANQTDQTLEGTKISSLSGSNTNVDIALTAKLPMTFMRLARFDTMDVGVSALATRGVSGSFEIGLVLDNTWSMSEKDSRGTAKIDTLKNAATNLVTQLFAVSDAKVKVALIPYADYVNVGIQNRAASWLSVPGDYSTTPAPKTCKTLTTKTVCLTSAPTYACTKTVDGVVEPATCGGGCTKSESQTVAPYQSCTGGGSPANYTWFGCVGSRMKTPEKQLPDRLTDNNPSDKYPGYLDTTQKCLNPIVPLTTNKLGILTAINSMVINIGSSYKPNTYIPAGLIWGQNMLSPTEPFSEGGDYDASNASPRKVIVLMTDGKNTLRFNQSDGKHVALSSGASAAALQIKQANTESTDICSYIKSHNIEVFTVAFMVDDSDARQMLADCATDPTHFYDASDAERLLTAFQGIGDSLKQVRLAR